MPVLGTDIQTRSQVVLTAQARRQGVYVIGTTGTGKTTLLQNIAYQDMMNGEGVCVLDPHGDFIDALLLRVPPERRDDVILFSPSDPDQFQHPLGLNLFDCDRSDPRQIRRVASTIIDTLYKLFSYSWGPRMEDLLRNSILTLLTKPNTSLLDLWLLLASPSHREEYTAEISDPYLRQFWDVQFAGYAKNSRDLVELVGSSLNKIGRFLADPLIRNIVAQPRSSFSIRRMMDKGKILLVNLSKGDLGEDNAALLGAVLVNQILIAALQRRDTPIAQRKPFHLIVDEYQSFATQSFPTLQSESRKYGIDVIVAHQYRDQLDELNLGSTLNVANFIVMRVSGKDSVDLAAQFDNTPPTPDVKMESVYKVHRRDETTGENRFITSVTASGKGTEYREVKQQPRSYSDVAAEKANQLSILGNYRALGRLVEGNEVREYEFATMPELGDINPQLIPYIRNRSMQFGKPKEAVEAFINELIGGIEFDDIPLYEEG